MFSDKSVLYLRNNIDFPPVKDSLDDGLLAAGGDLSEQRLLHAYKNGIFPWYSELSPILWYSPKDRCIFKPETFKISHSLKQKLQKKFFKITLDQDFSGVILSCANTSRKYESGTWILPEMIKAYTQLYQSGYAHSVEVWHEEFLVGGLYGVSLGRAFFGESMFHKLPDASKAALHYLCNWLLERNFKFIDAQMETEHLLSLGAYTISRDEYLVMLDEALKHETIKGNWNII